MELETLANWAGMAAIPLAIGAAFIAWRGVQVAKRQEGIAHIDVQLALIREQYDVQLQNLRNAHNICERELAQLKERLAMQRDELAGMQQRHIQVLTEMAVQRHHLEQLQRQRNMGSDE